MAKKKKKKELKNQTILGEEITSLYICYYSFYFQKKKFK